MRRIPTTTRGKSPQTQRAKTKEQRVPLDTRAKKSPPPLAVSKPENQSILEPRISSRSNAELNRLNNAANSSTAESAAGYDRGMKGASDKNHVSVAKASQKPERKQPLSPVLTNASMPKILMISTLPKAAAHPFDQYSDMSKAEYEDATQLQKMAAAYDPGMKGATDKNHVPVALISAPIPTSLMIATPSKAAHPFDQYNDMSRAEYEDAAQLLKMTAANTPGMKGATDKNHVPVALISAPMPKGLMTTTPSKAARAFDQYKGMSRAEYEDAAQLLKMAPKLDNGMVIDHTRFFTEGRDFLSKVLAYRRKTGDTKFDSTPPTAEQFAACEAELKLNDNEYQRYAYYLNHRHNKDYAMNKNMKSDFVEYGVFSDLIPKDKRPPADEIYSTQLVTEIKSKFKEEGTHVIVTADTFLRFAYKYGFHGRPTPSPDYLHGDGEMFNTETEVIQEIHRIAGANPTGKSLADAAQKVLGLTAFKSQILLHISIPPKAIKNERLPSGREHGANDQWLMGGTTPYGHLELITDRVNMAGIPGTDPKETAPTVRILGERGEGMVVYPGNYLNMGETVIEMQKMDAQKELHKIL
jgi:hypothetical protein